MPWAAGLFGSTVLLRGTLYRIVSVIQHLSSDTFRGNYLKRVVICELINTLSAVEMLHDSAPYKPRLALTLCSYANFCKYASTLYTVDNLAWMFLLSHASYSFHAVNNLLILDRYANLCNLCCSKCGCCRNRIMTLL